MNNYYFGNCDSFNMELTRPVKYGLALIIFNTIIGSILIEFLKLLYPYTNSYVITYLLNEAITCPLAFLSLQFLAKKYFNYSILDRYSKRKLVIGFGIYAVAAFYMTLNINGPLHPSGYFFFLGVIPAFPTMLIVYLQNKRAKDIFDRTPKVRTVKPEYISTNFDDYLNNLNRKHDSRYDALYSSVIPTGDEITDIDYAHGSARWLSDNEKNKLTDTFEEVDGINRGATFRGLWLGGGFFHHKEGNLLSIAPPGKGKGAALILPNLLWVRPYSHSFVVFDPKGTNAHITARFQKEIGQKVIIIDPLNLQQLSQATHGIQPSCFNPLDFIESDIYGGCNLIVNLMAPDDPKAEKFFTQKARDFMHAVMMHIMTSYRYEGQRNLITFYRKLKSGKLTDLFMEMSSNIEINDEISHAAFEYFEMYSNSEKTFYAIYGHVTAAINWLGSPALKNILVKSDFDAFEFENGGVTLYLCQPINNKEQFATFSRLVIGTILRANSTPSYKPKSWVYYLLDEFPSMGDFQKSWMH